MTPTDSALGLTTADVLSRRQQYGFNEVLEEPGHPLRRLLSKFWGVSAWMLELIMLVSAVLGKYSDLIVVGALLLVNAGLSYWLEGRAAGAVAALRQWLRVSARVLRNSTWQMVPSRELVPGDIVRVRAGDIIPADLTLLTGNLSVDQSALTGESNNAEKHPADSVTSGSTAKRGEATAEVRLIGTQTYFGRTTDLVQHAQPKLHIEAVVSQVVRWLFIIVGTLLALVVILSLIRHASLVEMIPLMLVLLMSAVPVALPVMFTVTTAFGSRELAKRGVLVTRLSAAEDAATMDVLCVDKTGTITQNQLQVTGVEARGGASDDDVIFAGAAASQAANQDPIDLAFLAAARQREMTKPRPALVPVSFTPFDAANRHTEAVVIQNGASLRCLKGAVRSVAEACHQDSAAIAELEARVSAAAAQGYRTLAVARGTGSDVPSFLGLVTLYDPPRPDAKQLVAALQARGVAVKMLTGDEVAVATEVGKGVGLPDIRRLADFKGGPGGAAGPSIDLFVAADGLAEIYPEDKYLVVKALQTGNHVTGMTGDGVNDAPALRQAEVGIAVSTASDIAKSAASVVLTSPGLGNIVALVEQGRTIYQRILTWIINKISRTIFKASFVAIAYLLTGKFVISAFAMLLITFTTDFAKVALATDRVHPSAQPESWNIGGFVAVSIVLGVAMLAESLVLLGWAWHRLGLGSNSDALNTFCFLLLLYFAVMSVYSARERRAFWTTWPSLPLLGTLGAEAILGTLATRIGLAGLLPLPWPVTLGIFAFSAAACLGINDALKVILIRWRVPGAVAGPLKGAPA